MSLYSHSIKALSQQAADAFAQINTYPQSTPNASCYTGNEATAFDNPSQVTFNAALDRVSFKCSTDTASCFFLACDSVNIACGIVGTIAGAIDRLCSSRERYTEKEVYHLVEESLYAIDQTRLAFYQQMPIYAQAVQCDLYYLEEIRQEMRIMRELGIAKNSYYHQAYSEIETRITRIVQELYNGQVVAPGEQKQRILMRARKAVDFIQAQKCKDTKQKQQLLAEYAAVLAAVEREYAEYSAFIEAEKKRQCMEQKQQKLFAMHISTLTDYLEGQKQYATLIEDFNPAYGIRIRKRLQLLEQSNISDITTQSYTVSENGALTLKAWEHEDVSIASNSGNQCQQLLHQELIDIIDKTVALPHYSPLWLQQQALVACSVSAVMYNQEGLTYTATVIADFCWALLDYGNAIVEGAALGVSHAAHAIITHPWDTAFTVVAGQYMLAYQLSTLFYTAADIGITFCYDAEQATEKWDACIKPITDLYDVFTDKEQSNHEMVKTATALAVGLYAHTKLLGGLKKLCTGLLDGINIFQRVFKNGIPQEYLSTPQGALYKASIDAIDSVKNDIPINPQRVNQSGIAILKNGYYEVNGLKFSELYYNKLWDEGRPAPSLVAREILDHASIVTSDFKPGFMKYIYNKWELVYNPITKEIWHLQPIKKTKPFI